jgi:hypothetical protein
MLSPGILPGHLKYPVIKPLFKNSKRNNISNYRPISLLISFSNVFEKVLHIRLSEQINNNNILVEEQFGFRIQSTTEKPIYKLITGILKDLKIKLIVEGIFCELEEGFYCVNHDISWSILKYNGIAGKANLYLNPISRIGVYER